MDITAPSRAPLPCALPDSPLANAAAGLDACVHCGFCLPACPTYVTLHDENDSPRGRLLLMRRLLDGEIAPDDPDVGTHLDRCLGCRGCETACPSGVPYGALLEATRATLREHRPTPFIARVVLDVFARSWLLKPALLGARIVRASGIARWLARTLPARVAFPFAMLASTAPVRIAGNRTGPRLRRATQPAPTATMLTGCVMQGLFAHVNDATATALRGTGHTLVTTTGQGCCGALHAHAGDLHTARALAKRNIVAFERVPQAVIAVNSAGCGAMLKEYGHLLHDEPAWAERAAAVSTRVRDISELLAGRLEADEPAVSAHDASSSTDASSARASVASSSTLETSRPVRVAYDAPCHLLHAQRISREPLAVLQSVPGIELVPLEDSELCCGSAGIYNLVEPETSDAVLAPKLQHMLNARADVITTGNPGCLMQLGAALLLADSATPAVHPVVLVADAFERPSRD
ncbi:MAG: heterodisulfide reductase-related iron-sulfur binding cluster [Gemmatimonadaceae bacterium]|jgi:glycolate oxidase iron-sulfur subunit|nr:heterodisulfide reductase-related iron-sulfur binding cluster [Gemmatimonadaceae bacterium]